MEIKMMADAIYRLSQIYDSARDIEKIILKSALTAAAMTNAVPGVYVPVPKVMTTYFASASEIGEMYRALCRALGISLKEDALQQLGPSALANIRANLGGALAGMAAGTLIPGVSIAVSERMAFAVVYLAGYIFLLTIANAAEKSAVPQTLDDISVAELTGAIRNAKLTRNDLEAAKHAYEAHRNDRPEEEQ